jgi:Tol biopolymer transport system component
MMTNRRFIARRQLLVSGAAIALAPFVWAAGSGKARAKEQATIQLTDVVPSVDGRTIVFEYRDRSLGRNHLGLGLLDVGVGTLRRIPNPSGWQLSQASFSFDGKQLVVGKGGTGGQMPLQIALVDLETLGVSDITAAGPGAKEYPVFQPETGNILYVHYQGFLVHRLVLVNPTNHREQAILDRSNGFVGEFRRPSFVNSEEIVFQARGPVSRELTAIVRNVVGVTAIAVAYRLKFGGQPSILSPEQERESIHPIHYPDGGLNFLSASRNGDVMTFVAKSLEQPFNKQSQYNFELFKMERGAVTQMTHLLSNTAYAHVSYDGSVVAFASVPSQQREFDLFIFDMKTKTIRATGLLERIKNNPDFVLQ